VIDAKAIAEAVLREAERLPRFAWSPEREAIRLRYDQRDRLVRERTKQICRLRNAALRLDIRSLPNDLAATKALAEIGTAAQRLQGRDVAVEALVDDVLFAIEDITRTTQRIKNIEAILRPLLRRIAPELPSLGYAPLRHEGSMSGALARSPLPKFGRRVRCSIAVGTPRMWARIMRVGRSTLYRPRKTLN